MLRHLAAVCVVLLSISALAEEAKTLYLQASEVNLRSKPSRRGKVVGKVTISTQCQLLKKAKRGWVQLQCGKLKGYTLGRFMGPEKPSLAGMLAQATDKSVPAKDRLNASLRAVALDQKDEQARKSLLNNFIDVEFENLAEALKDENSSPPRTAEFTCRKGQESNCLSDGLGKVAHDWYAIWQKEDKFLALFYWQDHLFVLGGTSSLVKQKLKVSVPISRSYKVGKVLLEMLKPMSRQTKEHDLYPLDKQSIALIRKMPVHWYRLRGVPEDPHFGAECGSSHYTMSKHLVLHEKGLFTNGGYSEDHYQDSAFFAIASARKKGHLYQLKIKQMHVGQSGLMDLSIDYPMEGTFDHTAHWKSKDSSGNYGVWQGGPDKRKQYFPVRQPEGCSEDDYEGP